MSGGDSRACLDSFVHIVVSRKENERRHNKLYLSIPQNLNYHVCFLWLLGTQILRHCKANRKICFSCVDSKRHYQVEEIRVTLV